jgi:hypothetical protein
VLTVELIIKIELEGYLKKNNASVFPPDPSRDILGTHPATSQTEVSGDAMHASAFCPSAPLFLNKRIWLRSATISRRTVASASHPDALSSSSAAARALAHRGLHEAHAAALRDALLSRASSALAEALTASAAASLHDAVSSAADASARLDAVARQLASTRDQAAARVSQSAREKEQARAAMERLETRVAFLTNAVTEKDRLLTSGLRIPGAQILGDKHVHAVRPVQCASDALSLLASLLLYPSLFSDSVIQPSQPESTRARGASAPEFPVAFLRYVRAIVSGSSGHAISAYSTLWRSCASPGRLGWQGEIAHAAATAEEADLMGAAKVRPDVKRALACDLRLLQQLYVTPVEDVAAWLGQGVGVTAPNVRLPERGFVTVEQADNELSPGDGFAALMTLLDSAADWGSEAVVDAVVENATNGPSQASSIADRYYGLKWGASGLEGVLTAQDVEVRCLLRTASLYINPHLCAAMLTLFNALVIICDFMCSTKTLPEYQFVGRGLENIRMRLRENCEVCCSA